MEQNIFDRIMNVLDSSKGPAWALSRDARLLCVLITVVKCTYQFLTARAYQSTNCRLSCTAGYTAIEVASRALSWTNAHILRPASSRMPALPLSQPGNIDAELSQSSTSEASSLDGPPANLHSKQLDMEQKWLQNVSDGRLSASDQMNGVSGTSSTEPPAAS